MRQYLTIEMSPRLVVVSSKLLELNCRALERGALARAQMRES